MVWDKFVNKFEVLHVGFVLMCTTGMVLPSIDWN